MAETLNTSHPLYANIVRALKGDEYKQQLNALDGKYNVTGMGENCRIADSGLTFTSIQGIATDGVDWWGSSTSEIQRYNSSSVSQATNSNPFLNLPAATNHCGDICVDDNYVYAVCDDYNAGDTTVQSLVRFNKGDLTYHSHWDIYEADQNASSVCIANGELVVSGFERNNVPTSNKATKLRRYNLNTGVKIGEFTLSQGVLGMQGVTYSGTHWFISSHDIPNSYESVYCFDGNFDFVTRYNPIDKNGEMEGIEWHNGELYTHVIFQNPFKLLFGDNGYISSNPNASSPAKFIDAADITDSGTIVMQLTAQTVYNFNSVFDNLVGDNDWESWIYEDGRIAWRVDKVDKAIHSTLATDTKYMVAFSWVKSGSTVVSKIGVNGAYSDSSSGVWKTPRDLYLGGIHANNNQGDNVYHDILVFDKELSDAELADLNTNFNDIYATASTGVPLESRLTPQKLGAYLRSGGYTGSYNDMVKAWLESEGATTGGYNDRMNTYLEAQGHTSGTLQDKQKAWTVS